MARIPIPYNLEYKVLTLNRNNPDQPVMDVAKGPSSLEDTLNAYAKQDWRFAGVWGDRLILVRS